VSAPPSVSIQTVNFLFLRVHPFFAHPCSSFMPFFVRLPLFAHPHSSFMLPAQASCFATMEVPAQQTLKLLTLLQKRSLHCKCFGSHKSTSNAHLSPSKLILCSTFNYRAPSRFLPIYTHYLTTFVLIKMQSPDSSKQTAFILNFHMPQTCVISK
jgi:hypothetical protein